MGSELTVAARRMESLRKAASELDEATTSDAAREAARDAALAVEYELDTLASELSRRNLASGTGLDPALLGRARALEAQIRQLLIALWEYQTLSSDGLLEARGRQAIVRGLKSAAADDMNLALDALEQFPALD